MLLSFRRRNQTIISFRASRLILCHFQQPSRGLSAERELCCDDLVVRAGHSPYLSTFGFLALVGLMSNELAGEVLQKVQLSSELKQKEDELRAAVADERSRIASDLHDSVTQTLFFTAAIADAMPEVWERHPVEARRSETTTAFNAVNRSNRKSRSDDIRD